MSFFLCLLLAVVAPPSGRLERLAARLVLKEPADTDFVITDDTDVRLDGKPIKYADVPEGAQIERLELAADERTILKIHFRSKK